MVQWVYERACLSDASEVLIATDDERIADAVIGFGGRVSMTSREHKSGTDRLQEVCAQRKFDQDHIIVNVQGDEPLIPATVINQVATNLASSSAGMSTLCEVIDNIEDLLDPNIVKVVTDVNDLALYFSRSPIPYARPEFSMTPPVLPASTNFLRHLGIYAYRVSLLNEFVSWSPSAIEETERLEQLRALWNGVKIHVQQAVESIPPGVDTEKDLQRTLSVLAKNYA